MRVLVVAQAAGLVLWNFDEQKRLGRHSIAASEFSEKRVAFARGITSSEDQILVGCSTGACSCPVVRRHCGMSVRLQLR
jgi:hypothetical protein